MVSKDDCLWGEDFFSTYMEHARKMSYNNDILHLSGALSLVGQSLRDVYLRIDQQHIGCRVHPFIIQSSGTGKGGVFSLIQKISRAADIPFEQEGTASTAGIMGTVKQNGEQREGDLAGSGFVGWTEAQTLLKSAEQTHSSDILEVMNMAMDPSGKVAKTLSGGKLEYESNTSVFCTTYDPEPNGQLELIRQGFLPRTLFFYRIMGEDFYNEINSMRDQEIPRSLDSHKRTVKQLDKDVEKLANTLKYIESTVWEHGEQYRQEDTSYAAAKTHIDYFYVDEGVSLNPTPMMDDVLEEYSIDVRRQARPFKTRMMNKVFRLAACFAAVSYDEEHNLYVSRRITQEHVNKAMSICEKSFRNTLDFIDDYSTSTADNDLREIERIVDAIAKNNGGHASLQELMAETYKSKKELKSALAVLSEMDKIETKETPVQAMNGEGKVKPK
jgi:uncharacterized protein YukE